MKRPDFSALCTLICLYIFAGALTLLVFFAPMLLTRYFVCEDEVYNVVIPTFYAAVPLAAIVLYALIRLVNNVRRGEVFIEQNVRYIRTVSIFLLVAALLFFGAGFFYLPFFFLSVAAAFVMLVVRVVKNCFVAAILLKEENDATI